MGTAKEHSVKDIVEICENILGRQIEIEQSSHLVRKVDRMHLGANIDKIREATGWQPKIEIYDTLKNLLEAGVEYAVDEI
jgi:UDP-glucose 4-epimerase